MRKRAPSRLKSRELNERQAKFVAEYIRNGGRGREAAIAAGYSQAYAEATASTIVSHPVVTAKIAELRERVIAQAGVDATWVLFELLDIYRALPETAIDPETGRLLDVHDMPAATQKSIQAIEVEELYGGRGRDRVLIGYSKKVKFYPRKDLLDQIGRHVRVNAFKTLDGGGAVPPYEESVRLVLERLAQLRSTAAPRTIEASAEPA